MRKVQPDAAASGLVALSDWSAESADPSRRRAT